MPFLDSRGSAVPFLISDNMSVQPLLAAQGISPCIRACLLQIISQCVILEQELYQRLDLQLTLKFILEFVCHIHVFCCQIVCISYFSKLKSSSAG